MFNRKLKNKVKKLEAIVEDLKTNSTNNREILSQVSLDLYDLLNDKSTMIQHLLKMQNAKAEYEIIQMKVNFIKEHLSFSLNQSVYQMEMQFGNHTLHQYEVCSDGRFIVEMIDISDHLYYRADRGGIWASMNLNDTEEILKTKRNQDALERLYKHIFKELSQKIYEAEFEKTIQETKQTIKNMIES